MLALVLFISPPAVEAKRTALPVNLSHAAASAEVLMPAFDTEPAGLRLGLRLSVRPDLKLT